jgi:hypothetical protein
MNPHPWNTPKAKPFVQLQTKPAQPKYVYQPRIVKGEVTFKEFVAALADSLGITCHCMEQRIARGKYLLDESRVRRGPSGRAIAVKVG